MTKKPRPPYRLPLPVASIAVGLVSALLASCGTPRPPKPPSVSEWSKRPVNDPREVENQMLRIQLRNHQLMLQLQEQRAEMQAKAVPVVLRPERTESSMGTGGSSRGNRVYVVGFDFGEANIHLTADQALKLLDEARQAAYIEVRGRTDGISDAPGEARVARHRAAAMKGLLVRGGVDASKVRVTYQPGGDHLSDNATSTGRSLNRRVEVELYDVRPTVHVLQREPAA